MHDLFSMASLTSISQPQSLLMKPHLTNTITKPNLFTYNFVLPSSSIKPWKSYKISRMTQRSGGGVVVVSATTAEEEKQNKRYLGEAKGFVEEMRFVVMKLHTKDQAEKGQKELKKPEERAIGKCNPTVDGYLKFLVDNKLIYDILDEIIEKAAF